MEGRKRVEPDRDLEGIEKVRVENQMKIKKKKEKKKKRKKNIFRL